MIKIIKGTYGLKKNGAIQAMTAESAPFSLSAKREAELVAEGIAVYTQEAAQELSELTRTQLKDLAETLGVDASKIKSKKEVIALIEDAWARTPAAVDS